ncbi:hypothetical protein PENTCL1PPCAC_13142, partial [Pristionchus entomophagus]
FGGDYIESMVTVEGDGSRELRRAEAKIRMSFKKGDGTSTTLDWMADSYDSWKRATFWRQTISFLATEVIVEIDAVIESFSRRPIRDMIWIP